MSGPGPSHPPEVFDSIIDFVHDNPEALKTCCLVSKSWVPRAQAFLQRNQVPIPRRYRSMEERFSRSHQSPAYHTRSLSVHYVESIPSADGEEGGWLQPFSNVVRLDLRSIAEPRSETKPKFRFIPFYGFSLVKHLRIMYLFLPPEVFNLICSLPLLDDLRARDRDEVVPRPSKLPSLAGMLCIFRSPEYVARRLLGLPISLRFRKFISKGCPEEDLEWVAALVERCSDTLESVEVDCRVYSNSPPPPVLVIGSAPDLNFHLL